MMTTTALLLTFATCIHVPHEPVAPAFPIFVSDSSYAAIARPISIKYFEDYGSRYWRAQYEVIAWASHAPRSLTPQRVVVEWSCDPVRDGGDPCGDIVDRVLPGFESHGRTDVEYVQLELRYQHASTFDGVELYYASRDGSVRLATPEPAHPFAYEGAKLKNQRG